MRRYLITIQRIPRHPPVITDPQNPSYSVRVIGEEVSTGLHDVYAEIRYRETQQLVPAGVPITASITAGNASFWASGAPSVDLDTLDDGTTKYNVNEEQRVQFDPATGVEVTYTAPDGSTGTYTVEGTGSGTPDYTLAASGGPFSGETNSTIAVTVNVTDAVTTDPVQNVAVAIASGYPTPSGSATGGTTDANGDATINWTLGSTETTYTLRVTTPDSGDTLDINAAATDPVSVGYTLSVENGPFSGIHGQTVQVQVKVVSDTTGDPVAGVDVSPVSGYPTPSGFCGTGTTDGTGIATLGWTFGSDTGTNTLRVEVASTGDFVETTATVSAPAAGSSPHFTHMRVAFPDYGTHYQQNASLRSAQYDFLAGICDLLVGGTRSEYLSRNPTIRTEQYMVMWAPFRDDAYPNPSLDWVPRLNPWIVTPMETWLTQNGYDPEDAYIHYANTSGTEADRVTAFVFARADTSPQPVECAQLRTRWVVNPADPGYQAWSTMRVQNAVAQGYDSVFIDEFNSQVMTSKGQQKFDNGLICPGGANIPAATLEFASRVEYHQAWQATFQLWKAVVPSGWIQINPATYWNFAQDRENVIAAGGGMFEFGNSPYGTGVVSRIGYVNQVVAGGAHVHFGGDHAASQKSNTSILSVSINQGSYNSVHDRTCMAEYCVFLMARAEDPSLVYFNPYETITGGHSLVQLQAVWLPAFEVDVGNPLETMQFAENATAGSIRTREYDNALVVFRARQASGAQNGTVPHTFNLPAGNWRKLNPDGTTGSLVTSVDIHLCEGIILMKG